jgi:acetolactate synthase-1/2/3 large subunit
MATSAPKVESFHALAMPVKDERNRHLNGAHALIDTLVSCGVDTCFANPGTSEMHFVAALDDAPGLRVVLGLFEGVVTGAADGYARLSEKTAATLLHLGTGMANGMANIHNARRARVPMVNIVGDHATYHKEYDAPLNSDIEALARTFSGTTLRPTSPSEIGSAVASAVSAAISPPNSISTLVLPADVSWGTGAVSSAPIPPVLRTPVPADVIEGVAKILRSGERCALLLGGSATNAGALESAARVGMAVGAQVLLGTSIARLARAGGLPPIARLNYRGGTASRQLEGVRHLVLVDAKPPVTFFAYPGKPSDLVPDDCAVHTLSEGHNDSTGALQVLAEALGATESMSVPVIRADRPTGALTAQAIAATVAALLPENAVVIDEGVTSSGPIASATAAGPRHDWLNVTGGAIGMGLPLAIGAAIAAPDRKVIGLQADGSSMYTFQALWTHAREKLDTTTIIFNNREYRILRAELTRVGATEGPKALDLLDLSRPDIDFVGLSTSLGVPAERATTAEEFTAALERALADDGPRLVEAIL